MRIIIASVALIVGLASPALSQTGTAPRRTVLPKLSVEAEPGIVGAVGRTDPRALSEVNAESRRREAEFNARLAERDKAAMTSLCIGCGMSAGPRALGGRRIGAMSRRSSVPDAETIYSQARGFDPAQATVD